MSEPHPDVEPDIYSVHPLKYLQCNKEKIGLIVLNEDIGDQKAHVRTLWNKSLVRAAADGGINRLHDAFIDSEPPLALPDYISGDFDSARTELLELYRSKDVDIIPTPDQNRTDFEKCLEILLRKIEERNLELNGIVVIGGLGGRFDHQMSNINTIVKTKRAIPIYLHSSESLAVALKVGKNRIYHRNECRGDWCGLVPLKSSVVTSQGLKWNLSNDVLEFGGLVSTSNKVLEDSEFVEVISDQILIWTMGIGVEK